MWRKNDSIPGLIGRSVRAAVVLGDGHQRYERAGCFGGHRRPVVAHGEQERSLRVIRVEVEALVGGAQPPHRPPYGRRWRPILPGHQRITGLPSVPVTKDLDEPIPVGPSGVMLGKYEDTISLMPLTDPAGPLGSRSTSTTAMRYGN
jgi:hypothetical protein